jgi:hypothetical protein
MLITIYVIYILVHNQCYLNYQKKIFSKMIFIVLFTIKNVFVVEIILYIIN